jgi:hypothetical protein
VVRGKLVPGEVDFHRFDLRADEVVTVSVRDPGQGEFADPLVGIFGPGDAEPVAVNDDGGPGFLSRLALRADRTGTWTVALTGFGDSDFDGSGHGESFAYQLLVAVVADPARHEEADRRGAGWAEPLFPGARRFLPWRAAVVTGSLEPGDVDRFSVHLRHGAVLTASLFDEAAGEFNDSVLRLVGADGRRLAENDDGGPGFLSNLAVRALKHGRGRFLVEITGFDPDASDGTPHPESFDYQLVISVEPPA